MQRFRSLADAVEALPDTGMIWVVGPDGSGKSFLVDQLRKRASSRGIAMHRYHQRAGLLLPKRARASDGFDRPQEVEVRRWIGQIGKILLSILDFYAGFAREFGRRRRGLVVFERPPIDMAVDPRRYRLSEPFGSWAGRLALVLPGPRVIAVCQGDPDRIHARKPELDLGELRRQQVRWAQLASSWRWRTIYIWSTGE
jgi:hypothetical protein